jgi:hypothetical protein
MLCAGNQMLTLVFHLVCRANPASNPIYCRCPAGYTTPSTSSLSISLCKPCPRGFTTNGTIHGTSCLPCPPSRWPDDEQYWPAVNRSSHVAKHTTTTLDEGTSGVFPGICIDALVYFERVRARESKVLEMTGFFKILTPGLSDPRDILSVWRAPMEQTYGLCNESHSLLSCTTGAYALRRQLAWAYTSAEGDEGYTNSAGAYKRPGSSPRDVYSFRFAFPSAGQGPYFLSLFSHKLQRTIAQTDYIPERGDCYPDQEEVLLCNFPEDIFNFQMYGPLSPCPAGLFTDFSQFNGCGECQPGTYTPITGLGSCLSCPFGKFYGGTGASECLSCNPGLTTIVNMSTEAKECTSCETLAQERGVPVRSVPGCQNFIMKTTTPGPTTTPIPTTAVQTTPMPLIEVCGDGILTPTEACDPGPLPPNTTVQILSPNMLQNLTGIRGVGICSPTVCRFSTNRCGDATRAIGIPLMMNSTHRYKGNSSSLAFIYQVRTNVRVCLKGVYKRARVFTRCVRTFVCVLGTYKRAHVFCMCVV